MNHNEIADVLEQIAGGINPDTGRPDSAAAVLQAPNASMALRDAARIIRSIAERETGARGAQARIAFYSTKGRYGFFSNFSRHPIEIGGRVWPTTEHFFQAKKFEGHPDEEEIRNTATPSAAAAKGRQRSRPLRADWESVKDGLMYEALRAKFTQHRDLGEALVQTGDAELVEHTTNDSYWGDGGDGTGRNMLGRLLMRLRAELGG